MNSLGNKIVQTRKGNVISFVAFAIPVFFVFIALAVDYGAISLGKHQLQNAADAGAIAAMETYSSERAHADRAAYEVINHNRLNGRAIDFKIEESVEYGSWDQDTQTFTPINRVGRPSKPDDVTGSSIPLGASAVRITLRRNRADGNGLNLFFAPIFGTDQANLVATAIASATPS